MDKLTESERLILARESALERWLQTENYGGDWGDIFHAGWDAAMEYVNAQRQAQPTSDTNRP